MATSNASMVCYTCKEETTTYPCPGCSKYFCFDDLAGHRESLKPQFHQIEDQRNHFVETLGDHKNNLNNHPLVMKINQWERTSIETIKRTAEEQRQLLRQSIHGHTEEIEVKLGSFTEEMQKIAKKKDFNEKVLQNLRTQFEDLKKQFNQPANIQIAEDSSTAYVKKLSITITATQSKVNC